MSAPWSVDDVIQIVYRNQVVSQAVLTVLHYRVKTIIAPGLTGEDMALQTATAFSAIGSSAVLSTMHDAAGSNYFFASVSCQKVKPTRNIYISKDVTLFGLQANPVGVVNAAASIEKQSTHVGGGGVGRLQWGGTPSDAIGSEVDPAYQAAFLNPIAVAINNVISVVSGGINVTLQPCLPGGGADHSYDLFDCVVKPHTRTMHRRTVGLGI